MSSTIILFPNGHAPWQALCAIWLQALKRTKIIQLISSRIRFSAHAVPECAKRSAT